jgi:hypothetical protein
LGSNQDVTYSYAERDLRKRYRPGEGWKIQRISGNSNNAPDYIVARKYRGVSEYVLASVVLKKAVLQADVDALVSPNTPENAAGILSGKMVLVPAGADSSGLPDDIEVVELKGFSCEGDEIVWWKSNIPREKTGE